MQPEMRQHPKLGGVVHAVGRVSLRADWSRELRFLEVWMTVSCYSMPAGDDPCVTSTVPPEVATTRPPAGSPMTGLL